MRFLVFTLTVTLSTLALCAQAEVSSHGSNMPTGKAMSLSQAIEANTGEPVKIQGQITEVCQKKGCFMVLTDGQKHARVTFKDYGFFVPKNSAAQNVVVYGELSSKTLSPEQKNHYEQDAGRDASYTESVTEFAVVASSVVIL